ncbi:MAG: sigma-54-dependent Fis family transcriptional regulator, partial [Myxococcales bacterium]|nr:sigma-54-dependent Fis family transcriptional regulator [Myxococcales bacterium]
MTGRLLIIDDDVDTCALLAANLAVHGYRTKTCGDASAALEVLAGENFDAVLTDVHMPGMTGLELCERLAQTRPDIPVIVMTGQASMENAVAALRAGAHDFVTKPVDLQHMLHRVAKALRHVELESEVRRLQQVLDAAQPSAMIGESAPVKQIQTMIARVAESDVPVLVTGESGVGKELVAREL